LWFLGLIFGFGLPVKSQSGFLQVKRVFITNVKGTFLGMSESEEASKRR
jgi:hypothetical protein